MYRRRGERFKDQCVYEFDQFGGGSVIVWDGVFHDGRTQLKIVQGTLNAVKYRDALLNLCVLIHNTVRQGLASYLSRSAFYNFYILYKQLVHSHITNYQYLVISTASSIRNLE